MEDYKHSGKVSLFNEHWSPMIVGELNDQQVKLVKFSGEFIWHKHDNEDELFLVVKGNFVIGATWTKILNRMRENFNCPRGVEH